MAKLSPMMQQYLDIKSAHKDHVLFFRLGDFYEMFFEDAVAMSEELGLALTARDCGLPERAPMCGIPYHAAEGYLKKLIDRGYKVAICEQTEPVQKGKSLVKREVTRIVTPGTLIEGNLLEDQKNNYIASFYADDAGQFAVCFADISTGEVLLTQPEKSGGVHQLMQEFAKFMPSEIIGSGHFAGANEVKEFMKVKLTCTYSPFEQEQVDLSHSEEAVKKHFDVNGMAALGLEQKTHAVYALGGLIQYLNHTQKNGAQRISELHFYHEDHYMNIDLTARHHLEITQTMRQKEKRGTLLWVLDQTKTAMGKRFLRKALEQPLLQRAEIVKRQQAVAALKENSIAREAISTHLREMFDLERLMTRVLYGTTTPRELRSLYDTLLLLPPLKQALASFSEELLQSVQTGMSLHEDVANLIDNAIVQYPPAMLKDGGAIQPGFHETLDELRTLSRDAKQIVADMEQQEREATGIKNLKIKYNRVFGYYLEVTNSSLDRVPDHYIRKQTLVGCERYITEPLKELEAKILTAEEKSMVLEQEIFEEVRHYVASRLEEIQQTANAIAMLDFLTSLASVAAQYHYVCPTITEDGTLSIQEGRHPVVERMLVDAPYVPNDVYLDQQDHRMMIITGPNMAGKSTYMRQVALFAIMAQIGSFVPAKEATLSLVDQVFTRVGASDDLSAGQSTFMVEMTEVAHILQHATPKSLVILDEIGRGTSTFDGMSIAKAVVEYITAHSRLGCKTMFATHYHELTSMEEELEGVKNYNIAVKKQADHIIFLRKIVRGGADDSFGVAVAKLAGIPPRVIDRANAILAHLEQQHQALCLAPDVATSEKACEHTGEVAPAPPPVDPVEGMLAARLRTLSLDTLTPIEALNVLQELKQLLADA